MSGRVSHPELVDVDDININIDCLFLLLIFRTFFHFFISSWNTNNDGEGLSARKMSGNWIKQR